MDFLVDKLPSRCFALVTVLVEIDLDGGFLAGFDVLPVKFVDLRAVADCALLLSLDGARRLLLRADCDHHSGLFKQSSLYYQ